ncbi:hypothetical protein RhiirA4_526958 [Rhizophagus irregularis]|uniref:Rad60/SUMO-like domain-containing protein n=1 Tax=Rhizophagus irregularis TaxID=588596 RepID=A0A2I1GR63_9GLOM|nr:hypothetical protein RhiirA4_526958 [Rhizophagus irregularis]
MDQLSPQFIKTEAVDPIDSFISFYVKSKDDNKTFCRTERTTPFKKLKEVYCKRNRLKIHATKFLFDGLNVMDNDTPDSKNNSIKRKETTYIVERAKPLKKLMESHAEINGLNPATLRFLFDGCRIFYDDTPDFFEMEDDDIIDYEPERIGFF